MEKTASSGTAEMISFLFISGIVEVDWTRLSLKGIIKLNPRLLSMGGA